MSASVDALDTERLDAYMAGRIDGCGKILGAEKFADGQSNPTFLLTTETNKYVLRRKPPGNLLKSAHAVDREFRVLQALFGTGVPVAEPCLLCEDDDVIGSMFYVMGYVEGDIFWDPSLPDIGRERRGEYHFEMVRVLAALHAIDIEAVGMSDFGKPGSYFERQISRWSEQYRKSETHEIGAMEGLMAHLAAKTPADDGMVSLIHGDFRMDNMVFAAGQPRAAALLDWELSTLGHPFADIAYYCMGLRMPRTSVVRGLLGLDRRELGVPEETELVERYCGHLGIPAIPDWNFHLAFCFFRLAAIVQGVYKRSLDGNASSKKGVEVGKMTGPLAEMGLELCGS